MFTRKTVSRGAQPIDLRGEAQPRGLGEATRVAAPGEQALPRPRSAAWHDGAHGMEDVAAGQVEGRGRLDARRRLLVTLRAHELAACRAQLHAGMGVDGVADAMVPGDEAAEHPAVRGIDDGVCRERGDVTASDGTGETEQGTGTCS